MPEYLNVTTRGGVVGDDTHFTLFFQGMGLDPDKSYTIKVIELEYPNNAAYAPEVRPIMLCDQSKPISDNSYTRQIIFKSPFPSGVASRVYCNSTNSPSIVRPLLNNSFTSIEVRFDKNDGTGPYVMTDYVSLLFEIDEV